MHDRSVRLDDLQLKWLAKEAARRDVALSAVVRLVIDEAMRRTTARRRVHPSMRIAAE